MCIRDRVEPGLIHKIRFFIKYLLNTCLLYTSIVTPKAVTGVPLLGFTFPSILGREPSFPIAYIILEPLIIKPFKVETAAKIPPIAIINAPLEVNVAAAAARGALSLANCA